MTSDIIEAPSFDVNLVSIRLQRPASHPRWDLPWGPPVHHLQTNWGETSRAKIWMENCRKIPWKIWIIWIIMMNMDWNGSWWNVMKSYLNGKCLKIIKVMIIRWIIQWIWGYTMFRHVQTCSEKAISYGQRWLDDAGVLLTRLLANSRLPHVATTYSESETSIEEVIIALIHVVLSAQKVPRVHHSNGIRRPAG